MKRKELIDFICAICLIVLGVGILLFPSVKTFKVKYVLIFVLAFYGIMHLIQFILTSKEKDYQGLFTAIASILVLLLIGFIEVDNNPLNLALTVFVWVIFMSLIKLKKSDYYHDRKKKIWMLRIVTLIIFILSGLVTVINLYYASDVQILILGFFYYINGILELVDPITNYLMKK